MEAEAPKPRDGAEQELMPRMCVGGTGRSRAARKPEPTLATPDESLALADVERSRQQSSSEEVRERGVDGRQGLAGTPFRWSGSHPVIALLSLCAREVPVHGSAWADSFTH